MSEEKIYKELDLKYLLKTIWTLKKYIIIVSILFGVLFFAYSIFFNSNENSEINQKERVTVEAKVVYEDAKVAIQNNVSIDYREDFISIMSSQSLLNEVIQKLALDTKSNELSKAFTIKLAGANMVDIQLVLDDKELALQIIRAAVDITKDKCIQINENANIYFLDDPAVTDISAAVQTESLSGFSITGSVKKAVMGIVIGAVLSVFVIVVYVMLQNNINTENDIEYMHLPVLASLPPNRSGKEGGLCFCKETERVAISVINAHKRDFTFVRWTKNRNDHIFMGDLLLSLYKMGKKVSLVLNDLEIAEELTAQLQLKVLKTEEQNVEIRIDNEKHINMISLCTADRGLISMLNDQSIRHKIDAAIEESDIVIFEPLPFTASDDIYIAANHNCGILLYIRKNTISNQDLNRFQNRIDETNVSIIGAVFDQSKH